MHVFHSAFGNLTLNRWPVRKNDQLQAWDAADEYLLNHLADNKLVTDTARVLVVNDAHGALCCALYKNDVTHWSDSSLSQTDTQQNSAQNQTPANLEFVKSTGHLHGVFDVVLIKIPKTNALLEDQLIRLRDHINKDSVIIAAAMIKHLQKSAFKSIEQIIGPLTTSLAVKKSRLIFTSIDDTIPPPQNPYPTQYTDPDIGMTLTNHASVFSRDHLDLGTRFFLSAFQDIKSANRVVDLACGNGVLGIKYQQLHHNARIQFIDESFMAIESARKNYASAFPGQTIQSIFLAQDGLKNSSAESCDLILCNPPFHIQHTVGAQLASGMFHDARRCLSSGGEMWVVSNHHLDYRSVLNRIFGNCRMVAKNKKFVINKVVKRH